MARLARVREGLARRTPRVLYEIAFAVITLAVVSPLFASRHVPLQDLPQHMAAISVLQRLPFDAELRTFFVPTLSRTQYLLVYLLGGLLSFPLGVEPATKLLAALSAASLPYALRFVLRRTGGDERLAALAWPLTWNPQAMLGFLNLLLGIPIALVALGLLADPARRRGLRRQVVLALLALAAFYSHLVPFGLVGLGTLLLMGREVCAWPAVEAGLSRRRRLLARARALLQSWRGVAFLVPSLVAAAVWLLRTPATDASIRAGGIGVVPHPEWAPLASLPRDLSTTLLDFPGDKDERALIAWGLCLVVGLVLARRSLVVRPPAGRPRRGLALVVALVPAGIAAAYLLRHRTLGRLFAAGWQARSTGDGLVERAVTTFWNLGVAGKTAWSQVVARAVLAWAVLVFVVLGLSGTATLDPDGETELTGSAHSGARLAWLPVVCALLYVCVPSSYGWIWPIHTRFAVAAALTAPLLLGAVRPAWPTFLLTAALATTSVGLAQDIASRFHAWEVTELGDLDAALAPARPGRRLIALVPAAASAHVPNIPLLHAAAYYQVRGGAVATFSFVNFPQSPFRYREGPMRPPRLPPRWEWNASLRVADPDLRYYDYVLARSGVFDEAAARPDVYRPVYRGREWNLYERTTAGTRH